jgi:uncharacterized protein
MDERFRFYAFKLAGLIVLIYIAQVFISGFTELFVLNTMSWVQPWRFLSALFLHGGLAHLVFNLFALLLFGSILEKFIGGKRFLVIFFLTGIFANLISINLYSSSLGASGAIFGVIGALILVRPGLPVWVFGLPMPIFVAGLLWAGIDTMRVIGSLTGNPLDNVGGLAHLSGLVIGLIFGVWLRKRLKMENGWVNPKVKFNERSVREWEDNYLR